MFCKSQIPPRISWVVSNTDIREMLFKKRKHSGLQTLSILILTCKELKLKETFNISIITNIVLTETKGNSRFYLWDSFVILSKQIMYSQCSSSSLLQQKIDFPFLLLLRLIVRVLHMTVHQFNLFSVLRAILTTIKIIQIDR